MNKEINSEKEQRVGGGGGGGGHYMIQQEECLFSGLYRPRNSSCLWLMAPLLFLQGSGNDINSLHATMTS